MAFYKGFSSFEFQTKKKFELTDIELVKMDLLNHIFTTRGSRVRMRNFGTDIPNMVFEPLDGEMVETVRDQLQEVFDYDPRVDVITFSIQPNYDQNELNVLVRLLYVELQTVDDFELNIQFGS